MDAEVVSARMSEALRNPQTRYIALASLQFYNAAYAYVFATEMTDGAQDKFVNRIKDVMSHMWRNLGVPGAWDVVQQVLERPPVDVKHPRFQSLLKAASRQVILADDIGHVEHCGMVVQLLTFPWLDPKRGRQYIFSNIIKSNRAQTMQAVIDAGMGIALCTITPKQSLSLPMAGVLAPHLKTSQINEYLMHSKGTVRGAAPASEMLLGVMVDRYAIGYAIAPSYEVFWEDYIRRGRLAVVYKALDACNSGVRSTIRLAARALSPRFRDAVLLCEFFDAEAARWSPLRSAWCGLVCRSPAPIRAGVKQIKL